MLEIFLYAGIRPSSHFQLRKLHAFNVTLWIPKIEIQSLNICRLKRASLLLRFHKITFARALTQLVSKLIQLKPNLEIFLKRSLQSMDAQDETLT